MKCRKEPCSDCPFTKSSLPGWLGHYESPEELNGIVMSELPFPCHMAQTTDLTWREAEESLLCAGAIAYMKKNAKNPRRQDLAELVSVVPKEQLDNILGYTEFINHHKKLLHDNDKREV